MSRFYLGVNNEPELFNRDVLRILLPSPSHSLPQKEKNVNVPRTVSIKSDTSLIARFSIDDSSENVKFDNFKLVCPSLVLNRPFANQNLPRIFHASELKK